MSKRKVVIHGAVFDYEEKAPFVRSGKSLLGALELDPESSERIRCHECGAYFVQLGTHVAKMHRPLTAKEYKRLHGLRQRTGLMAPEVAARCAARANVARLEPYRLAALRRGRQTIKTLGSLTGTRAEFRNLRSSCKAQLRERILRTARELQHTPTTAELRAMGIAERDAAHMFGQSTISGMMVELGLEPRLRNKNLLIAYTKDILVELLRDAHVALGRIPKTSDCHAPLLPSKSPFVDVFGSWGAALDAAGLGLLARAQATANRAVAMREVRNIWKGLEPKTVAAQ